jgi:hypothetical protein
MRNQIKNKRTSNFRTFINLTETLEDSETSQIEEAMATAISEAEADARKSHEIDEKSRPLAYLPKWKIAIEVEMP